MHLQGGQVQICIYVLVFYINEKKKKLRNSVYYEVIKFSEYSET